MVLCSLPALHSMCRSRIARGALLLHGRHCCKPEGGAVSGGAFFLDVELCDAASYWTKEMTGQGCCMSGRCVQVQLLRNCSHISAQSGTLIVQAGSTLLFGLMWPSSSRASLRHITSASFVVPQPHPQPCMLVVKCCHRAAEGRSVQGDVRQLTAELLATALGGAALHDGGTPAPPQQGGEALEAGPTARAVDVLLARLKRNLRNEHQQQHQGGTFKRPLSLDAYTLLAVRPPAHSCNCWHPSLSCPWPGLIAAFACCIPPEDVPCPVRFALCGPLRTAGSI